jgi:hypothetical protein
VESLLVTQGTITFTRRTLLHAVKQSVSQSVSWLPIIRYLVSFPCIYWRILVLVYTQHRTLTVLFSIMQNFSSIVHTTVLELTARSYRIFSKCKKVADNNLTQFKTSYKCIWKKKHTNHIHMIKHATLYTVTHTHSYQAQLSTMLQ